MRVLGLVGGIGSGKSWVAAKLATWGATVIDADRLGHDLWNLPDVQAAAEARWGRQIFENTKVVTDTFHQNLTNRTANNRTSETASKVSRKAAVGETAASKTVSRIDRRRVAEIVFASTKEAQVEKAFLDALMGPHLWRQLETRLAEARRRSVSSVVLDAALLFESGWNRLCDAVLFVDATPACRQARCLRRGWSVAEWESREQSQYELPRKRKMSDFVLENDDSSTQADIEERLRLYWQRFLQMDAGRADNDKYTNIK